MFNLDSVTNENNKDDNRRWSYRMLIVGPSGSGKTNALLNVIQQQDNDSLVDKIYLCAKDLSEPKYEFLIKKRGNAGIKHLDDSGEFIEYSNTMDDVYNNTDDPKRKGKIFILCNYMIVDIMTNKKFQAIIKELFIRCRKLNISLVFITQSYFRAPKEVSLNSTRYLIMRTHHKRELQNIAIDHSADINYKDFLKIYRNCTEILSFFYY